MSTKPIDLFYAGKLKEAVAGATEAVKKAPTDNAARTFLSELLSFAGDLDRADKQLEALSSQDPQAAVQVSMLRQVLRAEQNRQKFFTEGAVPEFLEKPGDREGLLLRASIALREKNYPEATVAIQAANALCPKLKGECDGKAFEGFRDTDDLTSTIFEVLAPNGKYYWIPMELVESIEFQPRQRIRDLLWRRGQLKLKNGVETETLFPAVYAGSYLEPDERLALGQMTDWRVAAEGAPARGVGLRTMLVGEEEVPFLDIKSLTFEA